MAASTLSSTHRFKTAHASGYSQQLCKHFAHKAEVEWDVRQSEAALSTGHATMHAIGSALTLAVIAQDDEGLTLAKHIIDNHMARFAHRVNSEKMERADAGE